MEGRNEKRSGGRAFKWIMGIAALLVLLAAGAWVLVFRVNQFALQLQLEGEREIYLEYGTAYEDPGVKPVLSGSLFWKEGMVPENVVIQTENNVNAQKLGKYTVAYSASMENLKADTQRTVWVVDTVNPVITLVDSGKPLPTGKAYEEEGYSATDNYDGDITHRVVRTETYGKVTYTVTDSAGNPFSVEREIPYYDPEPPKILLAEGERLSVPAGVFFSDPGYIATDNVDGDVTERVQVEGEVLWHIPGTYELTYSVADNFENSTTVTRFVEVQAQSLPEIETPKGYVIYLTFDDGPGPYTDRLLDVLDKYGVKATFFVVDTGYDAAMKRIADSGHSIGIHTVSHDYETIYAGVDAYFEDLYGMQEIIYENTGIRTHLLRFPGGSSNTVSCFNEGIMTTLTQAVRDAGFRYFDWNVDSNDAGGAKKTDTVVENVIKGIERQRLSVVLQHDIHEFSVDAVEKIIRWGLDKGYHFLPLEMDSPEFRHGVNN